MTDGDAAKNRNALAVLWGEVLTIVEPLLGAVDPWRRARLMRALGWDLVALTGDDAAAIQGWLGEIEPAMDALRAALTRSGSLGGLVEAGGAAGKAFEAVAALPPGIGSGPGTADGLAGELSDDLIDHLILVYLRRRAPWLLPLLTLLGLVTPAAEQDPSPALPAGDNPVRLPRRRDEVHLDRLADLVTAPGAHFAELYAPLGWDTPAGVEVMAARVLPRLAGLLRALGVEATHGVRPGVGPDLGDAGRRLADGLLRVRFSGPGKPTGALDGGSDPRFTAGFNLALASWDGRLTVILAPTGQVNRTGAVGSWNVATEVHATGPLFAINSAGVTVAGPEPEVRFSAEVARIAAPDEAGWVFGAPQGTHLAIGQLVLNARAALGTGRDDVELLLRAGRAELVVKPGDGDGLIRKLLPSDGLRIGFDLGVGWSLRTGPHLAGAAALTAEYPLHLTLGVIQLDGLRVALSGDSEAGRVSLVLTTFLRARIGPLSGYLSNLGVRLDLALGSALPTTADGTRVGNLGPADLTPRFQPPDGVSLRLDNGILTGGGYLFRDKQRGSYAGALELGVDFLAGSGGSRGFRAQLVAMLDTRNPDGTRITEADGGETFSMLAVGSLRWNPGLMLFWGIRLTGLGLLVGHNRRSNPEEVGKAARAGSLDHLLFPEDPVGRAPEIVAALSRLFPVDPTGTVVGAMVRLDFLAGCVVADLAVLVEFPEPIRILLLGKLVVTLGTVGKLQLNAAGVYDVDRQEVAVDAGLYDSNLFGLPVTGQMALRAGWGRHKHFAISIGGFHPRSPYPAWFPKLRRCAIALGQIGNGIRAETYLAVTANTVQFGGLVEVNLQAVGLVIGGRTWLDVLIQFDPLWFTAELGIVLTVKIGSRELLGLTAVIGISGPGLWRAWGRLRFKLLFLEVSKSFDWSHGRQAEDREPSYLDASGLIAIAVRHPRAWEVTATGTGGEPVTLRPVQAAGDVLLLTPGATLGVRQNVLPLDVDLERIGTSRIVGPNRFTITGVRAGAEDGVPGGLGEAIMDDFAPGQFRDLTPEEQLTTPGFERLPAGTTVRLPEGTALPDPANTVFVGLSGDEAYDRVIIDDPEDGGRPMPARPGNALAAAEPDRLLTLFAATGPAANARTRTTGATRFAGPGLGVDDAGPSWVPGRGVPRRARRIAARALDRPVVEALPTATQAAAVAPGGDRARLVRRRTVTVPYPTIALAPTGKVS
ncbi:DUF6603 domain-containing protein [Micromonospora eburnea]|uniref:DUF6603 domain-containing protein n=1 Tax=Micromonospora eburnea TaxID=227316 RepID=A0A1C6UYY7_9ACTN|nr:DUF6603 domain-containing protein [Micromonospora eburnea]SCL59020.1 hypothetical protein GA0070604_3962 [Micromonospora eburnea]